MEKGHIAEALTTYYGIAGNIQALRDVHRAVERCGHKMPSSRSWKGQVWWEKFQRIKTPFHSSNPSCISPMDAASSSHSAVNQLLKSIVRKICTLGSVGAGTGNPPSHPVAPDKHCP
jgi:hypothetical protein